MSRPTDLAKTTRWITEPSLYSGIIGAALAAGYGLLTLRLQEGTSAWFVVLAVLSAVFGTVFGDQFEQAGLMPVRRLAKELQRGAATVPILQAAASATHRFADYSFRINMVVWALGTTFVALVYRAFTGPEMTITAVRIALLGIGLAPLVSVITYLLVLERARVITAQICKLGLDAEQTAAALASGRRQLSVRLMLMVGIAGATPAIFIADVTFSRSARKMDELLGTADPALRAELAERLGSQVDWSVGLLGLALVAVGIATAIIAGRTLVSPLRRLAEAAGRVGSGALDAPPLVLADDEVWAAASSFAAMHARLRDALSRLRTAGVRLNETTAQLVGAGESQEGGSAEQAAALNETFATTEELARSAGQIAENAGEVASIAEKTLTAARTGQQSAQTFFASMVQMGDENRRVADSVLKLNKRVQQIGKVVEFIHEVGDKSDLLALNAELEGTKAGDIGRGFSLVAAEMRRLAESVVQSTHEIERLIDEIRDGTNAAVMATESGLKGMERGTLLARTVLETLDQIVSLARETSDSVRSISLSTQQQQTGSNQLTEAMAEILRITEAGAVAGQQMTVANQTLSQLASHLHASVRQLRLEQEEPRG